MIVMKQPLLMVVVVDDDDDDDDGNLSNSYPIQYFTRGHTDIFRSP